MVLPIQAYRRVRLYLVRLSVLESRHQVSDRVDGRALGRYVCQWLRWRGLPLRGLTRS
ncbi:hypothetical protein GBAR_LOCUS21980 [Geodia barretti]|uniref:Uncharacterized protein n=1 Tax=Geodia barretti TaxID=519541 RepID=A0AA35T377_GEOBA|nr:hypothetical protein GBAR_LOCUS21980 [Geodia barretti]